jgi:hypothetical protein
LHEDAQFFIEKAIALAQQDSSPTNSLLPHLHILLSCCWQKLGDMELALKAVENALLSQISTIPIPSDVLDHYVAISARVPVKATQKKDTLFAILRRKLNNLGSASIIEDILQALQSSQVPTISHQQAAIEELLLLYAADKFPIRHARFLVEKAKLNRLSAEKVEENPDKLVRAAISLLKSPSLGEDVQMKSHILDEIAKAYIWLAVVSAEPGAQPSPPSNEDIMGTVQIGLAYWMQATVRMKRHSEDEDTSGQNLSYFISPETSIKTLHILQRYFECNKRSFDFCENMTSHMLAGLGDALTQIQVLKLAVKLSQCLCKDDIGKLLSASQEGISTQTYTSFAFDRYC